MKIEFINYPFVFTDNGNRFKISDIKGTPRVGASLDENLNVLSNVIDENCINGVCDVAEHQREDK